MIGNCAGIFYALGDCWSFHTAKSHTGHHAARAGGKSLDRTLLRAILCCALDRLLATPRGQVHHRDYVAAIMNASPDARLGGPLPRLAGTDIRALW
jgi:hypothetical protein